MECLLKLIPLFQTGFSTDAILRGTPFPGLNIEGVGSISLPLCEEQAKKITNVASNQQLIDQANEPNQ